jgi:Winged helix-turn helix
MSSVPQNVIKHKVGLLNLAAELGNVSRACKMMGFSRDTFYRYQSAMEAGGVDALIDANRKKPNLRNRIDETVESAVVAFAIEQPAACIRPGQSLQRAAQTGHFCIRLGSPVGLATP